MFRSPLFGRRIHISGSISDDAAVASRSEVEQTREFITMLAKDLVGKGATFVIPVDAEKMRSTDGLPVCFDWLIWETIEKSLSQRPDSAPDPLVIAVQHHKNEEQVPDQYKALWDNLRSTDRVKIENASHWNMASKRMEAQAKWGDILIAIGGSEGVLFLANLYHDAGKPVIPLNPNSVVKTPDHFGFLITVSLALTRISYSKQIHRPILTGGSIGLISSEKIPLNVFQM